MSREELHSIPMENAELRTKSQHNKVLETLTKDANKAKEANKKAKDVKEPTYAVAFDSILNQLEVFRGQSTSNYVFDNMHDFLEDVCKLTLKYILHQYIFVKKQLIVADLNRRTLTSTMDWPTLKTDHRKTFCRSPSKT
jgi:hypothetical protein